MDREEIRNASGKSLADYDQQIAGLDKLIAGYDATIGEIDFFVKAMIVFMSVPVVAGVGFLVYAAWTGTAE